jgi:hypothetical protein
MATLFATALTAKIALTASTRKTIVQITAPTNQRLKILEWGVFFDEEVGDATPANPLLVSLCRQTGGTGTSNTPVKNTPASESVQSTAKDNFSVAATNVAIVDTALVNSQSGYGKIYPMGQEPIVAGAELWGIDITPGATISTGGLNVVAYIKFEE